MEVAVKPQGSHIIETMPTRNRHCEILNFDARVDKFDQDLRHEHAIPHTDEQTRTPSQKMLHHAATI